MLPLSVLFCASYEEIYLNLTLATVTFMNHLCLFHPHEIVTRIIWEMILETISLAGVTPAHPPIKRERLVAFQSLRKGPQPLTCDHHRP